MQDKLQELTDKLYREGLSKGKEEGERILAEAAASAEKTIADAKAEAALIIGRAEKEAEQLKAKVDSDLKMASRQCLQATKKDIENLLGGVSTKEVLSNTDTLRKVVETVAEKFADGSDAPLEVILPEALRSELEEWAEGQLASKLKGGIEAKFSKKISGGFTIAPRDGGYYISMTDETFDELIAEYLRPVTRKLLFG